MSTNLSGLIQCAYDAAGCDDGWQRLLGEYTKATGARSAFVVRHATATGKLSLEYVVGHEAPWLAAFFEHYQFVSPYRQALMELRVNACCTGHSVVAKSIALNSEFYCDFVRPQAFQINSVAARLAVGADSTSNLMVQYSDDRSDEFIDSSVRTHKEILPHIQGALRLHERMRELQCGNVQLLSALESTRSAVVVCAKGGLVKLMTSDAERAFAENDGLGCVGGMIQVGECRRGAKLVDIIAAMTLESEQQAAAVPVLVRVRRPSGLADYELLVAPVPGRHLTLRHGGARVIIFISDPDQRGQTDEQLLAELYGLTARERQVLSLLIAGATTAEMTGYLSIKSETIRTHFKALYSKTNSRSQVQLVTKTLRSVARLRLPRL